MTERKRRTGTRPSVGPLQELFTPEVKAPPLTVEERVRSQRVKYLFHPPRKNSGGTRDCKVLGHCGEGESYVDLRVPPTDPLSRRGCHFSGPTGGRIDPPSQESRLPTHPRTSLPTSPSPTQSLSLVSPSPSPRNSPWSTFLRDDPRPLPQRPRGTQTDRHRVFEGELQDRRRPDPGQGTPESDPYPI